MPLILVASPQVLSYLGIGLAVVAGACYRAGQASRSKAEDGEDG